MSYDISLLEPESREVIRFDSEHDITGGTYVQGGTSDAWLNITYNYAPFYYKHIDATKGIRWLYGQRAEATIPVLERAIAELGTDAYRDYWAPTPGNAGLALQGLLQFAKWRSDGVWDGD